MSFHVCSIKDRDHWKALHVLTLLNTVMDGLILFFFFIKRDFNFLAKIVKPSCPVSWLFYEILVRSMK